LTEPFKEILADGIEIWLGDCLDILPLIARVDAVVTDPPYSIPTQVAQTRVTTRNVGDLSLSEHAFRCHADAWKTLVGEAGRIFVFCDGTSYPVMFRAAYGRFNLASIVWDKGRIGMGREFRKSHEFIIHGWGAETPIVSDGVGYPDVIKCEPLSSTARVHPAEKPAGLLKSLLRVCGDVILDPFMGSASTGIAAIKTGRKFIGIEIEQRYFDIARRRLNETLLQLPIGGSTNQKQETLAL
jgi:site-specific DNA-methyltransferase (adenine-specific)